MDFVNAEIPSSVPAENLTNPQLSEQIVEAQESVPTTLPQLIEHYKSIKGIEQYGDKTITNIALFEAYMKSLTRHVCSICQEAHWLNNFYPTKNLCYRCYQEWYKKKLHRYNADNDMIPGDIPKQLQNLSFVEQLLIAKIQPAVNFFRLERGRQYGYRGNVINFQKDMSVMVKDLPRVLTKDDIVVFYKEFDKDQLKIVKEFQVRKSVILNALFWLKQNNKYYSDITINIENLQKLPDNDIYPLNYEKYEDSFSKQGDNNKDNKNINFDSKSQNQAQNDPIINQNSQKCENQAIPKLQQSECDEIKVDVYIDHDNEDNLKFTGLQNVQQQVDANHRVVEILKESDDRIKEAIEQVEGSGFVPPRLPFPATSDEPVIELSINGYFSMCFPTLFLDGAAEFVQPRIYKVDLDEYLAHLMQYKDQRFARHPIFRYWCLNTHLRKMARQKGNIFFTQKVQEKNLSVDDIVQKIKDKDSAFFKQINYYGETLRGSPQYWQRERTKLHQMIEQIGLPTFYITFSFADLYLPDLLRELRKFYPPGEGEKLSAQTLINDNPHVATHFFCIRLKQFFKLVLEPLFNVSDSWIRYEFQMRGSIHAHCLFWTSDAPDLKDLLDVKMKLQQFLEEDPSFSEHPIYSQQIANLEAPIVQWIDERISCMNPDFSASHKSFAFNPSTKRFQDAKDVDVDLVHLLNTLQRHEKCREGKCLHLSKGALVCRYGFPKPIAEKTQIKLKKISAGDIDIFRLEVEHQRNNTLINNYNSILTLIWRANTDIQYILNKQALLFYLTKYLNKSESISNFMEAMGMFLDQDTNDDTLRSLIKKMLIKTVDQRDYSAQETMHHLLKLPLQESSRLFKTINLFGGRFLKRQIVSNNGNDENDANVDEAVEENENGEDGQEKQEVATSKNILDIYSGRDKLQFKNQTDQQKEELNMVCLKDFVKNYDVHGKTVSKRRKAAVLLINPYIRIYKDCPDEKKELYYRNRLVVDSVWSNIDDILYLSQYCTYEIKFEQLFENEYVNLQIEIESEALENQVANEDAAQDKKDDEQSAGDSMPDASELPFMQQELNEEGHDIIKKINQREYDEFAILMATKEAQKQIIAAEELKQNTLGKPFHLFDQEKHAEPLNFIIENKRQVEQNPSLLVSDQVLNVTPKDLNEEQLLAYNMVKAHFENRLEQAPLRLFIKGRGGTGKSALIKCLHALLGSKCVLGAYQGVAAHNIEGYTLNSLYQLGWSDGWDLIPAGKSLQELQQKFAGVSYHIWDVVSMVGVKTLIKLHYRLTEIYCSTNDDYFGGQNVIIVGDLAQLVPVKDFPIYLKPHLINPL